VPRRIFDKADIRRRLNADREWSLYALADLDDGLFEHCDWWAVDGGLALVFRGIAIRPIFVAGDAASTRALLHALPETSGYLNLRAHQVDAAAEIYEYRQRHEMRRMILDDFRPRPGAAEPLGPADCGEIERLYASGDGGGIAFAPFQLRTGLFRGIRRAGALVAVAGVQVASPQESVAAIGNIFTHPDFRGQGLAQAATSAMVAAVKTAGIRTIGLNVESHNAPAIHAYESIGFRTRFPYCEGAADRRVTSSWEPEPAAELPK
jgi:ribosomal protein S18 acetylase RimI-like enzyme